VQQPIYLGGTRNILTKSNQFSTQIDQIRNSIEVRKLIEQVNNYYFQILLNRRKQQLSRVILQALREKEKSIAAAVRNGVLQESDLDVLRIELLKVNQQLNELGLLLKGLYANLNEYTGLNITDSTELGYPQLNALDSLPGKKLEDLSFETQAAMIENSQMISKAKRRPSVVAFMQAGYGRPALNMLSTNFEPYYVVGISLRWTIFDWNSSRNERQQLLLQKQYIENQRNTFDQNIRMACQMSQTRLEQLVSSLRTDSAIVELRRNITRRSSNRLDKGMITAVDYINDLNAEHQAMIQLETNAILWLQEKVNYLMLMGSIESLVLQGNK
jgi:outer membrane protein TolC